MTTHHKDACPCGSGKRYKHCHLPADQARTRRTWTLGLLLVGVVAVGAAAWGPIARWQAGRPGANAGRVDSLRAGAGGADVSGATAPVPSGAFGQVVPGQNAQMPQAQTAVGAGMASGASRSALAPGEHPVPWEFDVAKNRHYDPRPGHQHWHDGPPPSDTTQAVATTAPVITTVSGGNVSVTSGTGVSVTPAPSTALAPGENPGPWEFDAAKNRHYDPRPEHRHWHPGPPPPVGQR